MVLMIIEEADYDLAKSLNPEHSDDPEFAEEQLNNIVDKAVGSVETIISLQ